MVQSVKFDLNGAIQFVSEFKLFQKKEEEEEEVKVDLGYLGLTQLPFTQVRIWNTEELPTFFIQEKTH